MHDCDSIFLGYTSWAGALEREIVRQGRRLFPGVTSEVVQALIPWPRQIAPEVDEVAPPTAAELELLRRLDPGRFYLRDGRY